MDNKLSEEDLEGIVDEVDEDGSGTVDFDGELIISLNYYNIKSSFSLTNIKN